MRQNLEMSVVEYLKNEQDKLILRTERQNVETVVLLVISRRSSDVMFVEYYDDDLVFKKSFQFFQYLIFKPQVANWLLMFVVVVGLDFVFSLSSRWSKKHATSPANLRIWRCCFVLV